MFVDGWVQGRDHSRRRLAHDLEAGGLIRFHVTGSVGTLENDGMVSRSGYGKRTRVGLHRSPIQFVARANNTAQVIAGREGNDDWRRACETGSCNRRSRINIHSADLLGLEIPGDVLAKKVNRVCALSSDRERSGIESAEAAAGGSTIRIVHRVDTQKDPAAGGGFARITGEKGKSYAGVIPSSAVGAG